MKTFYASIVAAALILPATLQAQTGDSTGSQLFWEAKLPGGSYIVELSAISSVSQHTYVIDGALKVTEVIVDTTGNSLARFYYIIPITNDSGANTLNGLTERGKELLDTAGEPVTGTKPSNLVAKQYPTTTHAKTVEFRISKEEDLTRLLNSVQNSWMKNNGRKFTLVEK